MRYALIILTFIHGAPAKFDGFIASIFTERQLCCKSLVLFKKGEPRYQSMAICVEFKYSDFDTVNDYAPQPVYC